VAPAVGCGGWCGLIKRMGASRRRSPGMAARHPRTCQENKPARARRRHWLPAGWTFGRGPAPAELAALCRASTERTRASRAPSLRLSPRAAEARRMVVRSTAQALERKTLPNQRLLTFRVPAVKIRRSESNYLLPGCRPLVASGITLALGLAIRNDL
jgi:hypothetical protein